MQDVQQLHELLHSKCLLMIDLKEFNAFSYSNVDLFQYFQLMKKVSTVSSLIKMFLDRSFASSDFNEYFFIECILLSTTYNIIAFLREFEEIVLNNFCKFEKSS